MNGGSLVSPATGLARALCLGRGCLLFRRRKRRFSPCGSTAIRGRPGLLPTSSTVRPDFTDCGASSRMSLLRSAYSSSDLISSQLSRFSPERGRSLTRCQAPFSLSPFSSKLMWPFFIIGGRIAMRDPLALVPDDHRTGAVLALGDDALERGVVERVVLDMDGQPLLRRVEARPARHRPAPQHAVMLQPEIVVQPRRIVLLDDEDAAGRLRRRAALLAARLAGGAEIALGVILLEAGHGLRRLAMLRLGRRLARRAPCGRMPWSCACRRRSAPRSPCLRPWR